GVQLYDPYSNLTGPRTLLGNGCQIPATVPLDAAATKLLAYIPLPNLPGNVQNYLLQGTTPLNSDHVNIHLIHTINAKFGLNAGYNLSSQRSSTLGNFPDTGGTQSSLGQNFDLGVSNTWSPNLVEVTAVNWSRDRTKSLSDNSYLNNIAGTAGINGVSTDPINYGIPGIGLTSFSGLNDPTPSLLRNQTLRFSDNLTWTHAKHTLKFGGEVRRIQLNTEADPLPRGQFTFTGLMTSQLDANGNPVPGTGNDFADFLLGLPYNIKAQFGPNAYFRSWDFIAYAQDDWQVTKRFTFEAGLRYEAMTPPVELYNHIANLDLNADATQVDVVRPNATGLFQGAYPRALIHGDYGNWAPRIGFAWQPFNFKPKTIMRGGYSIFYNVSAYDTLAQQYLAYQPPFATSQNLLTSGSQFLTLENGFPAGGLTVPNTAGVDPFYKDGYAQ
ncbi:MAG: TonB-dependent receptor domain-containing protein, partial [Candidatus Acidiferrales bacterium]